jgi:uncharacterized protein (TIGR03000 family)
LSAVFVTSLGLGADAPQTEGMPATILVTLPADAKLTIDGAPTQSTTAKRWFVTPPLGEGNYVYVLKASFVRDGKSINVERKVNVQAGKETVVSLDLPGQTDSSTTSRAFTRERTSRAALSI